MAWLWKCSTILLFSMAVFAKAPASGELHFEKARIQLGTKVLTVEMADRQDLQERGLMFRKSLPENEGMLFVFTDERPLYFWMKNTIIDLSIGYFDKDGKLVDVQEMQATSVMDENPPNYPSKKPAKYALEMNKGWFAKNKVKIGTKLKILTGSRQ